MSAEMGQLPDDIRTVASNEDKRGNAEASIRQKRMHAEVDNSEHEETSMSVSQPSTEEGAGHRSDSSGSEEEDIVDGGNLIIVKETKNPRKRRKIIRSTVVFDDDDDDGEVGVEDSGAVELSESSSSESSDKEEEIEILSETKLDKAELLRREQKFKHLTCPVCLDTPDPLVATSCGHLFCCECILRALASSKAKSVFVGICPVCRKNVKYKDLQLLSVKHIG